METLKALGRRPCPGGLPLGGVSSSARQQSSPKEKFFSQGLLGISRSFQTSQCLSHLERKLSFSSKSGILSLGTMDMWSENISLFGGGADLCMTGCLAASLASSHQMLEALPSCVNQKCLQTLPDVPSGASPTDVSQSVLTPGKSGMESTGFPQIPSTQWVPGYRSSCLRDFLDHLWSGFLFLTT